jgi:osmotically-inducible protein OsmY
LAESSAFQETAESRAQLVDDLILSRVRAAIDQRFASIEALVRAGKVTLTGGSSDERMIVEVVRLVHTVEGVTGVESQIRHIAFQPST